MGRHEGTGLTPMALALVATALSHCGPALAQATQAPPPPWVSQQPATEKKPTPVVPPPKKDDGPKHGVVEAPKDSKVLAPHTPMVHRLVGIELPLAVYPTGTKIAVQDPWGLKMILQFNTLISTTTSGPVILTVESDESGLIDSMTRFTGMAAPYHGKERILWLNVRGPEGKILWTGNPLKKAMSILGLQQGQR